MALIDRILGRSPEPQSLEISTSSELDAFVRQGSYENFTGVSVNEETAMRLSAFSACVRNFSQDIASLSGKVYKRRTDGGREEARDHWAYPLVHSTVSPDMNAFEWREITTSQVLTRGNSFSFIHEFAPNLRGRRVELEPIHPTRVQKVEKNGTKVEYTITDEAGGNPQKFDKSQVFHVKGMSSDGLTGRSVVADARETLGYGLALQETGSRIFSNRANHGLALQMPPNVLYGSDRHKKIQSAMRERHQGVKNVWSTMLLEQGMDIKSTSMTLEDAQWIDSMRMSIADIARMFNMPLHRIAELSKSSFNNIEQQSIEYVVYSVRVYTVRLEQSWNHQLLKNDPDYYVEYNVDSLLRGEGLKRAQKNATEFQNGALTLDEWRIMENRNPYGGDIGSRPHIQMNLTSPDSVRPVEENKENEQENSNDNDEGSE